MRSALSAPGNDFIRNEHRKTHNKTYNISDNMIPSVIDNTLQLKDFCNAVWRKADTPSARGLWVRSGDMGNGTARRARSNRSRGAAKPCVG
jgi:hypothetical protein